MLQFFLKIKLKIFHNLSPNEKVLSSVEQVDNSSSHSQLENVLGNMLRLLLFLNI